MTPFPKPDNRLFLGVGGSGKSFLMRHQLQGFPRYLIHDVAGGGEDANKVLGDVIEDQAHLVERLMLPGPCRIIWRGVGAMGDAAFEWANEAAWHAANMVVVWEEIDGFTDAGKMPHWCHRLVHEGRHRQIRTFAVSRAPHMIPRNLTRNVTRICTGRITEPRDIKWFEQKLGDRETVNRIPGLADRQFLDWTEGKPQIRQSPFK